MSGVLRSAARRFSGVPMAAATLRWPNDSPHFVTSPGQDDSATRLGASTSSRWTSPSRRRRSNSSTPLLVLPKPMPTNQLQRSCSMPKSSIRCWYSRGTKMRLMRWVQRKQPGACPAWVVYDVWCLRGQDALRVDPGPLCDGGLGFAAGQQPLALPWAASRWAGCRPGRPGLAGRACHHTVATRRCRSASGPAVVARTFSRARCPGACGPRSPARSYRSAACACAPPARFPLPPCVRAGQPVPALCSRLGQDGVDFSSAVDFVDFAASGSHAVALARLRRCDPLTGALALDPQVPAGEPHEIVLRIVGADPLAATVIAAQLAHAVVQVLLDIAFTHWVPFGSCGF